MFAPAVASFAVARPGEARSTPPPSCRRTLGASLALVVCLATAAPAQVVLDGTANPAARGPLSGPDYAITADLGRTEGGNLFHSFERFSIRTGESATFSGPGSIENVISRVTGGARSDIDGALRSTIPGADFWFVNPAGVVFGPNATLDVQGSFHVSTADELRFADGAVFSATDPATGSTFTIAPPEAFGFLGGPPGEITVSGSRLAPQPGRTQSLVGGDVSVDGGSVITAQNVIIAAQESAGAVPAGLDGPAAARDGRVTIGRADSGLPATVSSGGFIGGTVRIEAGELLVEAATVGDLHVGAVDSTGGVDIAAERVTMRGEGSPPGTSTGILTSSLGQGRAGSVRVRASDVTLAGAIIGSLPIQADSGGIEIEADRIHFLGAGGFVGGIGAPTGLLGAGASGGTRVAARESLTIGAGGQIITTSLGDRPAGSIVINLDEGAALTMEPGSLIEATARGAGDGGSIEITGGDVLITGGVVSTETFAGGKGGTIRIDTGRMFVDNGFIGSNTLGTKDAGSVFVNADRVKFVNEGRVFNGTDGAGDGGDVTVVADSFVADATPLDHVPRFHTGVSASANFGSMGDGGDVTVVGREIRLVDGGEISSDTDGAGPGGNVVALAREELSVTGVAEELDQAGRPARIFASSGNPDADAPGGTVLVAAPTITVADGGRIASSSEGGGVAGTISVGREARAAAVEIRRGGEVVGVVAVPAVETLRLSAASITTEAARAGGGRIAIRVGDLIDIRDGSTVATSVAGGETTTAGDIAIDPRFIILDDSRIVAQAEEGRGGNIRIEVGTLFRTPDSLISASAGPAGIDGTVAISAPDVDVTSGLVALPAAFVDASSLLPESCAARGAEGARGSFVGVGKGGVAPGPEVLLPGFYAGAAILPSPAPDNHATVAGARRVAAVVISSTLGVACGGKD